MNVVFIVLDTVRKDRLSIYNQEIEFTESIQSFSEDATVFQDAVSQAPWTLPSHASMFTGLYPWEHDATQKQLYLETDKTLLAEKFENKGYKTACYTSNTWISPYTGMAEGFQRIDNFFGILPSDVMSGKTEKFWRWLNHGRSEWLMSKLMILGEKIHHLTADSNSDTKTPKTIECAENFVDEVEDEFFLFLNFMDAHLPYYPPEEYRKKHTDVDPKNICHKAHRHNAGIEKADFDALNSLYDAEVDYLDDQLGELFEMFEQRDLMEDTVFVIVSDHGENLGEDEMSGHQFSVSEQLVSVPMIVKAPELEEGTIEEQVELRQLYEMVPRLAGIEEGEISYGTDYALGGYQRPDLDINKIPDEKKNEFNKRLSFVRTPEKKLVRTESEEVVEDKMIDLETGEEVDIEDKFVQEIEKINEAEEGNTDVDEEHVKERLEELGYM